MAKCKALTGLAVNGLTFDAGYYIAAKFCVLCLPFALPDMQPTVPLC